MEEIGLEEIENIALGAAVIGSGGGGDPYIGKLMALQAVERYGNVKVLRKDEVQKDDFIIPAAMMGAPLVLTEKIPRGDEAVNAFKMLEEYFGKKVTATISIEAGGVNSTIPIALAATLRLPIIDADGMGRAFPEIQMVTPTIYGVSATPMAMTDEKGNTVLLTTIDNKWTERLSRAVTIQMGGSAIIALYAMGGEKFKEATIEGSLSYAEKVGRGIREAKKRGEDPVEEVLRITSGHEIFKGKITDVNRKVAGGFVRGTAKFEGIEEWGGKELELIFQNENLAAKVEDSVAVSVPDLIATLDIETGEPITAESLSYGHRCVVVGIPCDEKWRTKEGLELVGPDVFGYDFDYKPLERSGRS